MRTDGAGCGKALCRVVIAEDHPLMRDAIVTCLRDATGFEILAAVPDGDAAIRAAARHQPDVLLLDMELLGCQGSEVARRVRACAPRTRILVLSGHDRWSYIAAALDAGVSGYLLKREAPSVLIEALRGVGRGEVGVFSPEVAERIAAWECHPGSSSLSLTYREREVLAHILEGETNPDIALELNVSPKTVEKHVHNVLSKLGARTRGEAAVLAIKLDLL